MAKNPMLPTSPARKRPRLTPRARTTLPRLAVNATLAGLWASSLLALLVFFLNADISLRLKSFAPVAMPMMLFYAPLSGLIWAILAGGVRLFATFRVRTPWVGFRPFWRFLVADLCLLAGVYGLNLLWNQDYLPADMNTHLLGATLFLSLVAGLLAVDALWRGLARQRLRPWPRMAAALLLTGALLGIRERYRDVRPPRSAAEIEPSQPAADLLFIGLQGAAPDDLLPLLAAGQLPFLRNLFQQGSSVPLRGLRPPHLPAAWATILTGTLPPVHGIMETVVHDPPGRSLSLRIAPQGVGFSFMEKLGLVAAVKRRRLIPKVPTLDLILGRCGYSVLASGWEGLLSSEVPATLLPAHLDAGFRRTLPAPLRSHLDVLLKHLGRARADPQGAALALNLAQALRNDLGYGLSLLRPRRPGAGPTAILVRLAGLDRVKRAFMRYQRPNEFGNVRDKEIENYGHVIADYYRFLDAWIGLLADGVGEHPRIMVVNPYGLAPLDFLTRAFHAVTGQAALSGTVRGGGPGLLLAAGPDIRKGGRLEGATLQDVLPALLYLLDLPVGRDMRGRPLAGLVSDAFAESHAVAAVPSWGTVQVVGP